MLQNNIKSLENGLWESADALREGSNSVHRNTVCQSSDSFTFAMLLHVLNM